MDDLIKVFENTLEISKKYLKIPRSKYYRLKKMNIIWSDNTVESIFKEEGRIAALNFADDETPGGLVLKGATTQEECLCRCSNLYLSLIEHEKDYYIDGGLIYSKDVIFFKDSKYKLREPKKCDIITCVAIGDKEEIKEKMRLIIAVARENEVDTLILGKWGCGAYGRDWGEMKRMWDEVIGVNI